MNDLGAMISSRNPQAVVTRPPLRWFGGKFRLADWIISFFPPHRIYIEPYGGGASIILKKPRAYNETYNDLDGQLVNLFRVFRTDGAELLRRLRLTPYARAEYNLAFEPTDDPVERARRMVVRSQMGHGSNAARLDRPSGFRSDGMSGTTNVAGEWATLPDALEAVIERMRGVNLEQQPADLLLDRYDDPKALIYLDPPYLPETRSDKRKGAEAYHVYAHEMTVEDHRAMLAKIVGSRAMIVLSGYRTDLYDQALAGWERHDKAARAHRNGARTESLWLNPLAAARRGDLFSGQAARHA